MYREQLSAADDQLRAAHAAIGERDRLTHLRAALATELDDASKYADELSAKLADEQKDVERYQGGVWAFLYNVVADREARLSKEQREAHEAEVRYCEAVGARDRIRDEVASLDTRLAALESADADLAAARAGKQSLLVQAGGPAADELNAINEGLARIDSDGLALDEAIDAGGKALEALSRLAEVLGSARNWGIADMFSDSLFTSWVKRERLDSARGIAGEAQGAINVFRKELGDVGAALEAEVSALADHHRFVDTWLDNIFSDVAVQSRIEQAQQTTSTVVTEIGTKLVQLRAQRQKMIDRSAELSASRTRLLEHS